MKMSMGGFSPSAQVLCRQPKNMIIHYRSFDGMYRGRHDLRWQKLVTSYDSTAAEFRQAKICDVVQLGVQNNFLKIKLRNKKEVTCLPDQQFLTREGYRPANELEAGDCVGVMRSKQAWYAPIDSIERVESKDMAYGVTLDSQEQDSIIVNGIIAKV